MLVVEERAELGFGALATAPRPPIEPWRLTPLVGGVRLGGAMVLDHLPMRSTRWSAAAGWVAGRCDPASNCRRTAVRPPPRDKPNVEIVIDQAARSALRIRAEGRKVHLHCVPAHSRTPPS